VWKIAYQQEAQRELEALRPYKLQKRVDDMLSILASLGDPRRHCDVAHLDSNGGLKGRLDNYYRVPIAPQNYRIVFRLLHRETQAYPWRWIADGETVSARGDKIIQAIRIAHRDEVYNRDLIHRVFQIHRDDLDNLDIVVGGIDNLTELS